MMTAKSTTTNAVDIVAASLLLLLLCLCFGPRLATSARDNDVAAGANNDQRKMLDAKTACPEGSKFADICFASDMSTIPIQDKSESRIPPDPHGAAGMDSVIAVTNVQFEARTKATGGLVFGPTLLEDLFADLEPQSMFDPKIMYDVHRDRFVLVVLDAGKSADMTVTLSSRIFLAVSKGSNPTTATREDWWIKSIDSLVGDLWADYPGIAVDEEAVYITTNMFNVDSNAEPKGLRNSFLWIIDKNPLYVGGVIEVNSHDLAEIFDEAGGGGEIRTHMPAMVRASDGIAPGVGTYLVAYNFPFKTIQIVQVNDPLSTTAGGPAFLVGQVSLGDIDNLGVLTDLAPQKGTDKLINSGDRRAYDAVWANGQLWMTTQIVSRDGDGQVSAYWIKFDNANGLNFPPTLSDQGAIDGEDIGSGVATYYASVDANSKGVAAFGFAASSSDVFAGAYATVRDVDGTVHPSDVVKEGQATYFITFSGTRNRWGDYTGMALDPADDDCFWAFNQYAGDSNCAADLDFEGQFGCWNTAWARLCYPPKTPTPLSLNCKKKPFKKVCKRVAVGGGGKKGKKKFRTVCKRVRVCWVRNALCNGRRRPCCCGYTCRGVKLLNGKRVKKCKP